MQIEVGKFRIAGYGGAGDGELGTGLKAGGGTLKSGLVRLLRICITLWSLKSTEAHLSPRFLEDAESGEGLVLFSITLIRMPLLPCISLFFPPHFF